MRVAGETVGGRGVTLLAVTAVVGIVLGAHGWSGRHNGLPSGLANPQPPVTARASAPPTGSPTAAPSQSHAARRHSATPAPSPGPKLSAEPYSASAFQVWPGTPSAAARAAETGLTISVRRHAAGIWVTAGAAGRAAQAPRFYPTGAHVYVIEESMGDDSGDTDYNLGDDALVVTDAQGRILQ